MKHMINFFRVKDINLEFLDTRMGLLFYEDERVGRTWISSTRGLVDLNQTGSSRGNTARVHLWITILEHSIIEHLYVYRFGAGYDQSYTRCIYGPRRIIFVPYPCVYPWIARCIYRPSLASLASHASQNSKLMNPCVPHLDLPFMQPCPSKLAPGCILFSSAT